MSVKNKDNPHNNSCGYADPTAYKGLKPIITEENEIEKRENFVIKGIKYILSASGFELICRIEIRDKKSGKEFR